MIPIKIKASNGNSVQVGSASFRQKKLKDILLTNKKDEDEIFKLVINSWPEDKGANISLQAGNGKYIKVDNADNDILFATATKHDSATEQFVLSGDARGSWAFESLGDQGYLSNTKGNKGILMANAASAGESEHFNVELA